MACPAEQGLRMWFMRVLAHEPARLFYISTPLRLWHLDDDYYWLVALPSVLNK
jgi:hypothetical protein